MFNRETAITYLKGGRYGKLFHLETLETGMLVTMAEVERAFGPTEPTIIECDIPNPMSEQGIEFNYARRGTE